MDDFLRDHQDSRLTTYILEKEEKMRFKDFGVLSILVFLMVFFSATSVLADKASVVIDVPQNAAKGSEVVIRLTITHSANTDRHHVEWVRVWANNQEQMKWEYSSSKLPEGVPFARELKYKIEGDAEIKAEASCNVHGSKGPAVSKILIK
jgi:desulfoferrodoxin (superoxide reductase-like protein)